MSRKAQAILEFCLMFIIAAALIVGLLRLWKWSKDNIPMRQGAFEGSRVSAGKKISPGTPEPDGTVFSAGPPPGGPYLNQERRQ
jgi:hypothetical protein